MKFTKPGIDHLEQMMEKIERYYAFKYEVPVDMIVLIIKGRTINILVDGIIKESTVPKSLAVLGICEKTGELKNWR